jgi:GWxTD domain-containing protein
MRRYLHITALLLFAGACVQAMGDNLVAYLNVASYNAPGGTCYMETYLNVIGKTAVYLNDSNHKLQGKINIMVTFSQNDSIKLGNSYNLLSPEVEDTSKRVDFIDVQRYGLKRGKYVLEVTIQDKNNPKGKAFTIKQKVNVGYPMDSIYISDAEFLESYTASAQSNSPFYRNGYTMVPYVYTYYPNGVNQLNFYDEIYNTGKVLGTGERVIIKYFIESYETHAKLYEYNNVKVTQVDSINPVLGGFNIEKLPSGNYYLVVQAIDKYNTVRATHSYPFLRSNKNMELSLKDIAAVNIANSFVNKYNNKDTLAEYIKSLWPISSLNQREFIKDNNFTKSDLLLLQQYFYNFWVNRNPNDPEGDWKKYNEEVKYVNQQFKTFGLKGYETDRGRVYLQYGPPDQRVRSTVNPTSYPYEIWEYYRLSDGEIDRKFVFYEPDLVTNNYQLLHSTARGEIQNRQWQVILNNTMGTPGNVDQNTITDPFGENTLDDFSNPR